MTAFEWFYSFLRKHNRKMFFGLVLVTIISILAIVKPIVSGAIVDDVIIADPDYDHSWCTPLLVTGHLRDLFARCSLFHA